MVNADVEVAVYVVRTIAQTALDNETYFGDLDAVVGDGDFGYSLARGFESLLAEWATLDRTSVADFLGKVAVIVTSRVGGTSGPIWGTGFLRASAVARAADVVDVAAVVAMVRAAVDGISARGGAELGDKTLLDVLIPVADTLETSGAVDTSSLVDELAVRAREASEATRKLQARRGRASYAGERSIGSLDAGGAALALMLERIAAGWSERATEVATTTGDTP